MTSLKVATIYRRPRSLEWKCQWKYLKFQPTICTGKKLRTVLWSWKDGCNRLHRKITCEKGTLSMDWNWRPTYRLYGFWGKMIFTGWPLWNLFPCFSYYILWIDVIKKCIVKLLNRNLLAGSESLRNSNVFAFNDFIVHVYDYSLKKILIVDFRRRSRQLILWRKISWRAFRAL